MPGLEDRLVDLIHTSSSDIRRGLGGPPHQETLVRNMWVQVHGYIERNQMLSKRVTAHTDVFFDKIYPTLLDYFGHDTEKNVMIICADSYAVSHASSERARTF